MALLTVRLNDLRGSDPEYVTSAWLRHERLRG